jgi:hypothetical protein
MCDLSNKINIYGSYFLVKQLLFWNYQNEDEKKKNQIEKQ